jgi:transcription antitermination protein NusB
MQRKKEREIIVLALYSMELSDNDMKETVNYVLEEKNIEETPSEYILSTIEGVRENQHEIDCIISDNLENYKIDRLAFLDLAIIRFATYEMKYGKDIHYAVVINEAVDLTKKYSDVGDGKASAFNNKLLDKIKTSLNLEGNE